MKKIVMIILDGFGCREEEYGNAIKQANMPNFNMLWDKYPHSLLKASEEAVGLPIGQMGGSEVGHMTIGAGRVIKQEILKINDYFANNQVVNNEKYQEMIANVKSNNSNLHLMGLLSDGGVHSHIDHFKEMIKLIKTSGISKCYLHLITDGRDTGRESSLKYIKEIEALIKNDDIFSIATICGRYYAMDRDNRWERTKIYYDLVVNGLGYTTLNYEKTINSCYKKQVFDEFLPPIVNNPEGLIRDNDYLMWMNFRADRAKQTMKSLTDENFSEFKTKKMPNLKVFSFFEIDKSLSVKSLFEGEIISNSLGKYFSELGFTQARIAETEKFAHVTYFFDGMYRGNLAGCDKILVHSPDVSTYDKAPKMSAAEVSKKVCAAMNKDYDFILVNFANPDMVAHTGNIKATVEALEEVDRCLGEIIEATELNFYTMFLLADHGNAEYMLDSNGNVLTSHSLARVPFIVTDNKVILKDGSLANVAPSLLKYLDIKIPEEMKDTEIILDFKGE